LLRFLRHFPDIQFFDMPNTDLPFDGENLMYKKILIPTDGSELSRTTALSGIEFARQNGNEVVGLFVAPEYQYPIYVEMIPPTYPSEEEYEASMRRAGDLHLDTIRKAAEAAGIKFASLTVFSDSIAGEIVHTAQKQECDLIFMGSHGRSGWGQAILGSVTTKVLSTCQIPVLVHRLNKEPVASSDNK
jgi:nucleotide-binding universal stress UspA family protein